MTVQRYDYAPIKASITEDGYLTDSPVIARVGIQSYQLADGTIRKELRMPEDVFDAESLASFANKPLTDDHPNEKVNAKNFKKYAIGVMTGAAYQDGDNVRVPLVMLDGEAIDKAIKGGKRELSVGYSVVLDETPGIWNGEAYQARQTMIRANHLSLVKKGRAGNARLTLDRFDAVSLIEETEPSMSDLSSIKLDSGLSYSAAPEVVIEVERLRADALILKTQSEASKADAEKLAGERDTLKARMDAFPAELAKVKTDALDSARAEIKARAELDKAAEGFKVDCAGKSDREVKEAVIKAVRADADLTGKSDEYVNAAFDMSVSMKADTAMQGQRKQVLNVDAAKTEPRHDYKTFMSNLGKKKE